MPSYVVRASRDADSPYLYWSTVVDNATAVARNRDEMREYLLDDGQTPTLVEERLARADASGCSALEPPGAYGWNDEGFIVHNTDRRDAAFFDLPRDRLADYARHLLADDTAAAEALLIPHPMLAEHGPVSEETQHG